MLIQSRSGGVGARWKQLSKLGKVAFITVAVFFLLAILWGTGTVDVDYVRNQFKSATENHGDEPIPEQKNDAPIIDGVPNNQNDRPIPNGVIEEVADNQQSTEKIKSDGKLNENATPPINTEPVKVNEPEQSLVQDATSSVAPKPTKTTTPVQSYYQGPTSSFELKPVKTEHAKPQPIAGGVPPTRDVHTAHR
ncbi:hypothetical protein NUW58_g5980 [Xylaria curta]|uniref:Uncharacterized protein n=1 Tax=Xylaria curta TaxID=42375 RepID=A0ACC1P218_9PEZI|nr:hypothetical protein NUW58_g5980 [Xylaria curta]